MEWKEITTETEWKDVLGRSSERSQLILKHSTTCPVSANAFREFEEYIGKGSNNDVDYTLVKVIESRPVSNQIAEDLGVKHESPQVIFIKNNEKYWTASHWSITKEHITAVLD
ncbi:general stress protein [Paenibacillus selenitireducens]|jgi:bacillithiol system protein YtxJ|uniref:General stress protein n=1 Tax=Paenibacillus selenitireducens TaxID=1324314 RepID=A0A1T2X7A7_9BACL|nr:bacillithiol system redox-active protein YtxJ [Paenibacillus selenitireducens]OPA75771.1 general stress protein [Paenibacillus selenitireducens]